MRTAESILRASYKPEGSDKKIYFGNADGKDSKKNDVKVIKRNFLVPQNQEEFLVYIGGEKNFEKAMNLIAEDYSGAESRKHLINDKLHDASVREEVLKKVLQTSETFTLAGLLEEEASVKEKAAVTDEISAIPFDDPEYLQKVQAILARVR